MFFEKMFYYFMYEFFFFTTLFPAWLGLNKQGAWVTRKKEKEDVLEDDLVVSA